LGRSAVVNSFHSSSVKQIYEYLPDLIVCLDSHPDTHLFGLTDKLMKVAHKMPSRLRNAVLRPSAHALMRRMMPDVKIFLVMPEICLRYQAVADVDLIRRTLNLIGRDMKDDPNRTERYVELNKMMVSKLLRMILYLSPPQTLKKLAYDVRQQEAVVDLDADYMLEFQGECYTMAPAVASRESPELPKLGTVERVLKFIKLAKPKLVTVSEMTLKSLRDSKSSTAQLLKRLQAMGYRVEYGDMVSSDEEAHQLINRTEDFMNTKLIKIVADHGEEGFGHLDEFEQKIAKAMEEYFLGGN